MAKSNGQKRRREAEAIQEHKAAEAQGEDAHPSKKSRVEEKRSLFVRSLPPSATSESLAEWFSQHYPVKHATVVVDPSTKKSRGYGFVTFTDADDALEAKQKLNNELWDGRRLRLDVAEPRNRVTGASNSEGATKLAEEKKKREQDLEEAKKAPKLIVRNLPWSIKAPQDLAALFRSYGKVKFADLPQTKGKLSGFGFVTLRGRKNAEKAIEGVNGKQVDGRTLAVDWAVSKDEWEKQKGAEEAAEKPKPSDDEDADEDADKEPKSKGKKKAEMSEADADLENFMREHMENLEDEKDSDEEDKAESDDDSKIGDEDEEEEPEVKPKRTTDNSTTVFIRNLPFTTDDEGLKSHFSTHFGPVRYARVVMDRATERPAGTGFVCFAKMDDFKTCLKGAPRQQPITPHTKHSVLQNELVDPDGKYTMEGRVLQVAHAVGKDEATRLTEGGVAARKGQEKDKRRLYLLSEGTIPTDSPLYALLSPPEVKLREQSAAQRKKMVEGNPSLHISLTRLAVRNLPRNIGSKELKALAREAVVGFAKDVKEGRRQALSKEELTRGGEEEKEAERRRKEKGKGVVSQAKIVFETKEGSKTNDESGGGKSRGYGFIEYASHRLALMGLRWLNGHALKNEAGKTVRLVVEFAIENANVISRRKAAEERSKGRAPNPPKAKQEGEEAAFHKGKKQGGKFKGRKAEDAKEETKSEPTEAPPTKDAAAKLAMRQRIIGRKRMVRKKKAVTRRGA